MQGESNVEVLNEAIKDVFFIIMQPPIYEVIVYFRLCHDSVNYCPGNSVQFSIVKNLLPCGAMDDLVHYCTRP